MLSDKEQKKEFKKIASKNPQRYYAVDFLQQQGFERKQCTSCHLFFWSVNKEQLVCGDSKCSGGFRFIGDSPAKKQLAYTEVWDEFSAMFKRFDYKPIQRYPVVSRWNPTTDFTIASIAAFQPFVVSGEVKPPAEKIVIPQFCLRFNDVDNVGITGAHMTGFVMIGQHQFVDPSQWNQSEAFAEIHSWLIKGLGLPKEEITYHEDAWAGGGNFGPCMEFFSRGVEIGNQVYMMYEQTPNGPQELKIKVLDMGMGQERNAWFSQGSASIYDATFPDVCKKLYEATGVQTDLKLMQKFIPLAGLLNADETENIEQAWETIAKTIKIDKKRLQERILPLSGVYSIAEHARSLLVALNDTGLPSNVGGGYNLRMIARRCFQFMDKYQWKVYLPDICAWHADEMHKQFPELKENLEEVKKILDVEKVKYENTKQKSRSMVEKLVVEKVTADVLLELYDSQGIQPEVIVQEAAKQGKIIKIPDNFYGLVAQRHEKKVQEHETQKEAVIDTSDVPATKLLFYDDWKQTAFEGKVLKVVGKYVILDQTIFYPTSGGQLHDLGTLNDIPVIDVIKQGKVVVHILEKEGLRVNVKVKGMIDRERRVQLAQHHTSTHIVNAAARRVIGKHINQAGAKKTMEKAHIDLTHYQSFTEAELEKIEAEANKIIQAKVNIVKSFMPRDRAEKKYGFLIYQGGVPIGKELRIVDIEGIDVEACGGTHLDNTGEAEEIKIIKASKIADGVVRVEFVAGAAARKTMEQEQETGKALAQLLSCNPNEVPGRAEEVFTIWKNVVKKGKTVDITLKSHTVYEGKDSVEKVAEILKTPPEAVIKTIERFLREIKETKKRG